MFQPETSSSHAPSLVLVAPMPRRPIALVARRHHHHHSRSRSSRIVSGTAPSETSTDSSVQRVASPLAASSSVNTSSSSPGSTVRLVGHPYSRAKTPSNATSVSTSTSPAAANGWPLGLGISPVSPPPRSKAPSREGSISHHRRMSSRDAAAQCSTMSSSFAEAVLDSQSASLPDSALPVDEPMLTSPVNSSSANMDVERTPTKRDSVHLNAAQLSSANRACSDAEDDQEPRSTPTIGAASPRPDDQNLTLSPTSPTHQRFTASASASSQLPLSPSTDTHTNLKKNLDTASPITPSPCLSESQSRSPTASPSPCPSPKPAVEEGVLDRHRKMGLPLPPVPSSPIPRKMTRNPFERYLSQAGRDESGMTLHARLAQAMAQSGKRGNFGVEAMEAQVGAAEGDEEMASLECLQRPAFKSVDSGASRGSRMDVEE